MSYVWRHDIHVCTHSEIDTSIPYYVTCCLEWCTVLNHSCRLLQCFQTIFFPLQSFFSFTPHFVYYLVSMCMKMRVITCNEWVFFTIIHVLHHCILLLYTYSIDVCHCLYTYSIDVCHCLYTYSIDVCHCLYTYSVDVCHCLYTYSVDVCHCLYTYSIDVCHCLYTCTLLQFNYIYTQTHGTPYKHVLE